MGLDTTHGCWHGAYSNFHTWRIAIARAAGMPPLEFMEGFYLFTDISHEEAHAAVQALGFNPKHKWGRSLLSAFYSPSNMPIRWDSLLPSPLHTLLNHSDCDGEIPAEDCTAIADALEVLLPALPEGDAHGHIGNWRAKTQTFIDGLRLAASLGEPVGFH